MNVPFRMQTVVAALGLAGAALFSTALLDQTCPPSSVYAAYNHYAGSRKSIRVYPFNDHEGGQEHQVAVQLTWLQKRMETL